MLCLRTLLFVASVGVAIGGFATNSAAFDTGHHQDLLNSVMKQHGFTTTATQVAIVENWLVDYYASSPTASSDVQGAMEKLHFDNLYKTKDVAVYWSQLMKNIKSATEQMAENQDKLGMLTVIGMSSHAVQDFYTHSNWNVYHQVHSGGSYNTNTYLNNGPPSSDGNVSQGLHTGKYPNDKSTPTGVDVHGDYNSGLNKDSHIRPAWDQAYVFAYAATHELLTLMKTWSDDKRQGFWSNVQNYSNSDLGSSDQKALQTDLDAAFVLSMLIDVGSQDGHWKGNLSGDNSQFTTASAKWTAQTDSIFVKQVKSAKVQNLLAKSLYDSNLSDTSYPQAPQFNQNQYAVTVRVTSIAENSTFYGPDGPGDPDFYPIITIGNQVFRDRILQEVDSFDNKNNTVSAWWEMYFISQNETDVNIQITCWDSDYGATGSDDHIDLNPNTGQRDLNLKYKFSDGSLSGDVTGVHNSWNNAATVSGKKPDSDGATIKFYVTHTPLKDND